jgi:hypothetical protein
MTCCTSPTVPQQLSSSRIEYLRSTSEAQIAAAGKEHDRVISVEVAGDPSRIDPLLQGIDFARLATALTR